MLRKRSMQRGSGILLHITSLPSRFGIGDFGPGAYRFVDFLSRARQKYWQILPLNPTDAVNHHSPYSCLSAFAGNELFISPELLAEEGWVSPADLRNVPSFSQTKVQYASVSRYKRKLLRIAYGNAKSGLQTNSDYVKFCRDHRYWLDDYALFRTLKTLHKNKSWIKWPAALRNRDPGALVKATDKFSEEIAQVKFLQFIFFRQWLALKKYCHAKGIEVIGDIPIYVNHDSAEVWSNRSLFKLEPNGEPRFVAGVPPDYFSKTGQRWGNPVYDWGNAEETGYAWWIQRIKSNLEFFDHIRVDHFRGFAEYWEIPAGEKTAVNGRWVEGPRHNFFKVLLRKFSALPFIAEDLGIITQDVKDLMARFGFPGMKILQFAFGNGTQDNPYLPHNYTENCLVYTGTHDNNTTKGWFRHDAQKEEKANLSEYSGKKISEGTVHKVLIRLAAASKANVAVIPMQDVLGLGRQARMNVPGTLRGNWRWRVPERSLTQKAANYLADLAAKTQRE